MKDKDLVGKPIVSMADGAKIGTVKHLVFLGLDLEALVVKGDRGEGLLLYKSVGVNGPGAITIESYILVDWNAAPSVGPNRKDIHQLRKMPVVDNEGKMLVHMHDLTIDVAGHVEQIDVRTESLFRIGAVQSEVAAKRVRIFGSDLIPVDSVSEIVPVLAWTGIKPRNMRNRFLSASEADR